MPRPRLLAPLPSLLTLSWLSMTLLHELGHVLAALATGGHVQRLIYHPLVLSRTDVSPNPHPLIVTWSGPLLGSLLPLLPLLAIRIWIDPRARRRPLRSCPNTSPFLCQAPGFSPGRQLLGQPLSGRAAGPPVSPHIHDPHGTSLTYLFSFLAGFCLLSNGLYLASAPLTPAGDARELLRLGTPHVLLPTIGLPLALLGLYLWHRTSPRLGFGPSPTPVPKSHAYATFLAATLFTLAAFVFGNPGP